MARAIWSGSITFGLLNVPVKLYSAVSQRRISLREIRASDGARIRHRRVAEGTDEEVPFEEIVKAFEVSPDRYIPLTKDEMTNLAPEKTRAIEVLDFVDLAEIDPIYFDNPYYIGPTEGAEKAYSLLATALQKSGKVAIARFVFRNKEHLGAIRPAGGVLTLTTMRFSEEIVSPENLGDELFADDSQAAEREVEMAEKLIDSLTREFDPDAYHDEYRQELMALVERKADGEEVVAAAPDGPTATGAPDLMAALEESVAALKGDGGKAKGRTPKSKAAEKKNGSRAKAKSAR